MANMTVSDTSEGVRVIGFFTLDVNNNNNIFLINKRKYSRMLSQSGFVFFIRKS